MTRTHLVVLSILAACGKSYEVGALSTRDDAGPATLLGCPPGTEEAGKRPPEGYDLWCAKASETGALVRHGPARSWWPDGRLRTAGQYVMDKKVGQWWSWTADGVLEAEGPYVDDVAEGYWLAYDGDGKLAAEGPMVQGGREGLWVIYDTPNAVPTEGLWVDGAKEGTWVEYDASGKPIRERVYRRGRQISQREL